jgi:hypothetical protein
MPIGPVAFIGAFAAVVGVIMWRLSTTNTTPEGYTKIGSFDTIEIIGTVRILKHGDIPFITDDHTFTGRTGGRGGFTHVLVPTSRAAEAIDLIKRERAEEMRDAPPA